MKLLSRTLLDELAAKAAASPRARAHYNIHATPRIWCSASLSWLPATRTSGRIGMRPLGARGDRARAADVLTFDGTAA